MIHEVYKNVFHSFNSFSINECPSIKMDAPAEKVAAGQSFHSTPYIVFFHPQVHLSQDGGTLPFVQNEPLSLLDGRLVKGQYWALRYKLPRIMSSRQRQQLLPDQLPRDAQVIDLYDE
ncbi:hypothetical protein BsIDN1_66440 [Bacillus safensis]|uniref:Uncharacterized protein n=1 Tax=Bacillus safensis TaxID=561879 RepID=A0A5S9MMT6_BACIA|nr:hypothetical protein BsIDN1_66440 [Bacillus safensis]